MPVNRKHTVEIGIVEEFTYKISITRTTNSRRAASDLEVESETKQEQSTQSSRELSPAARVDNSLPITHIPNSVTHIPESIFIFQPRFAKGLMICGLFFG